MILKNSKLKLYFILSGLFLLLLTSGINAATFGLTPNSGSFEIGCTKELVININATGESSNAAEIIINFDPTKVDILDSDPDTPGTQILEGNAYTSYIYNSVDESSGVIRLAAATYNNYLTSSRTFGTIELQGKPGAGSASFTIDFAGFGNTFDSNIADSSTNLDLLTGVTSGTYNFIVGPCGTDVTAPSIIFLSPTSGQQNFPVSNNIQVRVTDSSSGIDLSEMQFVVNGDTYFVGSPQVSYTGSSNDYTFTINPTNNLNDDAASSITVIAVDNAGNQRSSQNIFNVPEGTIPAEDQEAPTVLFINAKNFELGTPDNPEIEINIVDELSAINQDSIQIYVNGELYVIGDPEVTLTENSISDLFLLIRPSIPIDKGTYTVIQVLGQDIYGNKFDRQIVVNLPTGDQTGVTPDQCQEIVDEAVEETVNEQESICKEKTQVIEVIKNSPVNEISTVGSSAILVLTALPLILSILSVPGALLQFIGVLLGKSQEKPWGMIKDVVTGKPISFAVCNIYNSGSSFKVGQVVTDLEGRYGFNLSPGKYRLEVKKSGYKEYINDIEISEGNETSFVSDIELSPLSSSASSKISQSMKVKMFLIENFNRVTRFFFYVGIFISFFSFYIDQSIINFIIVVIYILLILFSVIPRLKRKSKYATVVSAESDLRIPYAQVKIFDPKTMKLVDTKTTNQDGYFDFYGEPGQYAVTVIARGFDFPSADNPYPLFGANKSMVLVDLKRGGNKLSLFVGKKGDRTEEDNKATQGMSSPFS